MKGVCLVVIATDDHCTVEADPEEMKKHGYEQRTDVPKTVSFYGIPTVMSVWVRSPERIEA